MTLDWRGEMELWLSKQSQWFVKKLWQVIVELQAERELLGKDTIKIPLERFKKKNIDLDDVKKILINLDNKQYVSVGKIVGSDVNKTVFLEQPIRDDERLFYDPETKIELSREFDHLRSLVEQRVHPEKEVDDIINQFSQENLPFVLMVLNGIKDAVEFASKDEASYKLRSHSGTNELVQERQLLHKLESLGLFRHAGEDGIFGIATLREINLTLIQKCIEQGRQRLAVGKLTQSTILRNIDSISTAIQKRKTPLNENKTTQGMSGAAGRWLAEKREDEIDSTLKKVGEYDERLEALEQQVNAQKMTSKQAVKAILKQYKFPTMQKKLINALADTLPKDTKPLETEVDTKDLPSLKRDTLAKIKKKGLSKNLSIKSYKGGFDKYFYQLEVNLAGLPKTNNKN